LAQALFQANGHRRVQSGRAGAKIGAERRPALQRASGYRETVRALTKTHAVDRSRLDGTVSEQLRELLSAQVFPCLATLVEFSQPSNKNKQVRIAATRTLLQWAERYGGVPRNTTDSFMEGITAELLARMEHENGDSPNGESPQVGEG
jgi:hypothetical protein